MQKMLSGRLLDMLTSMGYNFLLARQIAVVSGDADTCITLTPVKFKPSREKLAEGYDNYYSIGELTGMAANACKTIMVVDVGEISLDQLIESYLVE